MIPIITSPEKIENSSFKIIDNLLAGKKKPSLQKDIITRVIHATADLNYAKDLLFHPKAVANAQEAIRKGKNIIVDSNMLKAGINKKIAAGFGIKVICFIDDEDITRKSVKLDITRAILAMRKSVKLMDGAIVAIGNAPTALFELCDLIKRKEARPALVVGLPVGFVGAAEAKKKLLALNTPYITNRTRFGGSSAAAACVNALLKIAKGRP